jgi:carbohydrate diacid regulator
MFNKTFAQNFVDKLHRQLGYHINIMNEKGIIIASSDYERIGDFHIIAHDMIAKKMLSHCIDSVQGDLIGVKRPGVNLLLLEDNVPVGVVGVSGDPKKVSDVAKTIKFALESMTEYLSSTDTKVESINSKLAYSLLTETPLNPSLVLRLAEENGYKNECMRFPILIIFSGISCNECMSLLLDLYCSRTKYDSQDIVLPIDSQNVLFLLSLPEVYEVDYELYAEEVAKEIKQYLSSRLSAGDFKVKFVCGIPQTNLISCREEFQALQWLKSKKYHRNFDIIYLKRFYIEYTVGHMDRRQLGTLFDYYVQLLDKHDVRDMFVETIGAMVESDMRIDAAAAKLFMHKNTVMARMKKIRELLGIRSTISTKDAAFLTALYEYIVMNR